nr:uncharacterized protein LOC128690194 [Cherax quadricarinatus]
MTSAVEEPKQNEDYYTTTEFESEFTTETSFLEESEAHDTLPTTYRPEISLSVDPSQTVSNVRSRALESQSSSSSLTSNSLTSVKNSRRRGRGRLTTSSTDPSSAPSVPEGPSQDISKDNTQPSKPTSRHHKTNNLPTTTQATPPVTVRAAGVQVTPFTPAGSRRRVTSSRGTTSQRLRDPQPDLVSEASVVSSDGGAEVAVGGEESSQSSGARKVVKKKIVINGRPGSRGSQEVDTTEISSSAPRPRGRHELGTPQASTPSPRPRGRHELGTPQVSTPATTNQEDEEKRKHQIALEALAKFNPALANARILSVRFIPKTKNKSEKSTTEDPKETATDTPPAVGSSRSINGQRRNSRRINDVATTTPATVTQSSRGTSRERLRPLAVRQPSVITTEAPATATPVPAPFQRSRNSNRRGSSRKETLPTNEVTTTPASASISDSSDSSFSNEFQSQRRGTVRTDHASSSRRRVLKKVTPLSHGNTPTVTNSDSASSPASSFSAASRSSSSRNSVSSSSDSSLSLSSITTEDNLSSTAENSGVSSGRNLRVVGTSIKSSVSRVSNNKDDALLSSESSSAASSSGTLSQSNRSTSHPGGSNNSRSPTRRVTRPNTINTPKKTSKEGATDDHSSTKSTHNPLTDVEIEALSALANVTTSVGSSPQESARVFPDILPEAEDDTRPRRINSRRTKNWTSRGRSRSESNS